MCQWATTGLGLPPSLLLRRCSAPAISASLTPYLPFELAEDALRPGMFTLRGGRAGRRLPGFAGR